MDKSTNHSRIWDFIVIGGALFSMFFGSGNLVFPPQIGVLGGSQWWLGFIAYFIIDAGFAVMTVIAMTKADGDMMEVNNSIGQTTAMIISIVVLLCIGPGLAIPRNGAVAFEVGFSGMTGIDSGNRGALAIFSICFFAVALLLTIRSAKVVDIVGKILTPVLVVFLIIMIIAGIVNPGGDPGNPASNTIIRDGVYNGYQTMDLMAAMYFAFVAIQSASDKGYRTVKSRVGVLVPAGILSSLLLEIVYGGLAYLGASTGHRYTGGFMSGKVSAAQLLTGVSEDVLGRPGLFILGIVVLFACMTTVIGLLSATGGFFEEITHGKLKYEHIVIFFTIISAVLCNIGLDQIISISAPILTLVYPVVVFTVVSYFFRNIVRKSLAYKFAGAVTFIVSLISLLCDTFGVNGLSWIHNLPMDTWGLNWLVPCLIAFVIGWIVPGPLLPEVHRMSDDAEEKPGIEE